MVWDPVKKQTIYDIELIQNNAIRFIVNLKGRTDSVPETRNQLDIKSLEDRRKNHQLCLLTRILQEECQHQVLSKAYDELLKISENVAVCTRVAAKGHPNLCFLQTSL